MVIRKLVGRKSVRQLVKLGIIGVLNTINYFLLFNLFRSLGVALIPAITLAFAFATLVSYVLNRRWTFRLDDNTGGLAETLRFYLINVVAWAVTVAITWLADRLFGPLGRIEENLASLVAAGLIIVPKFLGYRGVVFGRALQARLDAQPVVYDPPRQ